MIFLSELDKIFSPHQDQLCNTFCQYDMANMIEDNDIISYAYNSTIIPSNDVAFCQNYFDPCYYYNYRYYHYYCLYLQIFM